MSEMKCSNVSKDVQEQKYFIKEDQVSRYIDLVARRTYILCHSGVDYKPEYADELVAIDKELSDLRVLVDEEHQRRADEEKNSCSDDPDQEQDALQLQTEYGVYNDVLFYVNRYMFDHSLCIQAYNYTDGPIARLTVCLCDDDISDDEAYVDNNNNPWIEDFIRNNHLGRFTGKVRRSGYCLYPLYEFDIDMLLKYSE